MSWLLLLAAQSFCAAHAQGSLARILGGAADGFELVSGPRPFSFPRDHGPHPAYRAEWWYFTGRLVASEPLERQVGFQLTFFRFGLGSRNLGKSAAAGGNTQASSWRSNEVWMAHFAVTDVANERFHAKERFARGGAIGLAGVTGKPLSVRMRDWVFATKQEAALPWSLHASDADVRLDVELTIAEPLVLQGDQGFSRKSAGPGNASYYYSMPRLRGRGRIKLGDELVEGPVDVWLDREWSTSALGDEQVGWDWFALHLDDDSELMLYGLRRADGTWDRFSAGTLVKPNGDVLRLRANEFELRPSAPVTLASGRAYPLAWEVRVPAAQIDARVRAVMAEQEHTGRFPYWEGMVQVDDANGSSMGTGYLEMTGYADESGQTDRR